MFDLGLIEVAFIAGLALVVVGPKDLPVLVRAAGKIVGKAQRFYRDTIGSIHKLEREMELASRPADSNEPSYSHLLPDHVKELMKMDGPHRDAEKHRIAEEAYRKAMAEIKAAQAKQAPETQQPTDSNPPISKADP